MMTIPTIITLFRIFLVPVLVLVFYLPFESNHLVASALFALAALTDWLDGYLARLLNQTSRLGAFLDPIADKIIVVIALVMLIAQSNLNLLVLPVIIIIGREIIVTGLREWMAEIGKRANVAVSVVGKFKTVAQMLAIILLLAYKPGGYLWLMIVGASLLVIAALLTLWSMFNYIRIAWPDLTIERKKE